MRNKATHPTEKPIPSGKLENNASFGRAHHRAMVPDMVSIRNLNGWCQRLKKSSRNEQAGNMDVLSGPPQAGLLYFTSLRSKGASSGPYSSMNLGHHVNDNPADVAANRLTMSRFLAKPLVWLEQVHSDVVLDVDRWDKGEQAEINTNERGEAIADAAMLSGTSQALAIMTADCLPIVLSTEGAQVIAVVHGGWRGVAQGLIEKTVKLMERKANAPVNFAWIGPSIGSDAFEVGVEVR